MAEQTSAERFEEIKARRARRARAGASGSESGGIVSAADPGWIADAVKELYRLKRENGRLARVNVRLVGQLRTVIRAFDAFNDDEAKYDQLGRAILTARRYVEEPQS